MWRSCGLVKPILYLYIIMPSINFGSSPGYFSRRVAYVVRIKRDGDSIKGESKSLNTLYLSVQLGRGGEGIGVKLAQK
jgi:hypothetical protein